MGWIRFDDLQWEGGYRKWLAYGQSKLANLLFAFELQRHAERADKSSVRRLQSRLCGDQFAGGGTADARSSSSNRRGIG